MASARQNHDFTRHLAPDGELPVWPLDVAIDWVADNLLPVEVFGVDELTKWAIDNGFKQP